jgi:mono/diheme cytochrome c family protein
MYNQPKATPLGESDFFGDGRSARGPVPGTVARGQLAEDRAYAAGIGPDGKFVGRIPVPVDRALLMRGRERFDIFCAPCHDRTGSGQGMIVQRGYKRPPSLHEDRLRNQPIGYFFDVMTNGFTEMPAYASQIPRADRWAIASYIRALQFSQHAPLASLPAEDVTRATAPVSPSKPPSREEAGKEGE